MQRLVLAKNCMPTVCVDTNIWIYALSAPKQGDATKHQLAQHSIQNAGNITLTPQIINELGFALRRKHAWNDDDLRPIFTQLLDSCSLHIPSSGWHLKALDLRSAYALSYWDSLIVAAALEANCNMLITEDMQHQQQIEGLRIVNPFI